MKKTALLLVTITQVFTTFAAENVSFRDGTHLRADIYKEKGFEPDKDGVILSWNNKIYIHHYPVMDNSLSVPYFYYHGPSPYGMSSCVPSRISFFHFQSFTLVNMKEKISKMNIPKEKKEGAIKGIDKAMSDLPPKAMSNPKLINNKNTREWKARVMTYIGRHFPRGHAVWGEDLKFLKKNDLMNKSRVATKK